MLFENAIEILKNYCGDTLVSFESNQTQNGANRFEFIVTKNDGLKYMIHVGESDILDKGLIN